MSAPLPFVRGQNAVLTFSQDRRPVTIRVKTYDLTEESSEHSDGVNGEHRDRLDKTINSFSLSMDLFQEDQTIMEAYMAAQDADDANQLPLHQTMAIQITHRDGTRASYILQECKVGPMKLSNSSRQEVFSLNLKVRFRFMKRV